MLSMHLRLLRRRILQALSNEPKPVHSVPDAPTAGQRIIPLADISVPDCAIMTADEFTSSTAVYIGYLDASSRTSNHRLR